MPPFAHVSRLQRIVATCMSAMLPALLCLGLTPGHCAPCRQFSIADCLYVSGLERFAANMPAFRGLHLQGNPQFPHLDAWFAAMDAKPAYQRVKSDALTLNMVYGKLFGAQRVRAQPASEAARQARREVAAKLHKNHDVVLAGGFGAYFYYHSVVGWCWQVEGRKLRNSQHVVLAGGSVLLWS